MLILSQGKSKLPLMLNPQLLSALLDARYNINNIDNRKRMTCILIDMYQLEHAKKDVAIGNTTYKANEWLFLHTAKTNQDVRISSSSFFPHDSLSFHRGI